MPGSPAETRYGPRRLAGMPAEGSLRERAEALSARGSISLEGSSGGSTGTSRPRHTIGRPRQATTVLSAIACWRRVAVRCSSASILHHERAFHQRVGRLADRGAEIRRLVPGEEGADVVECPNPFGRECHDHPSMIGTHSRPCSSPVVTGPLLPFTRHRATLGVDMWGSRSLFCLSLSRRQSRRPRTGSKAI